MLIKVEHHHYFHYHSDNDFKVVKDILNLITKKLETMPTKAEFQAALADVGSSLQNISDDITRLTDQLATGGLSASEEEEIFNQLRGVADTAKALADRTVDPSTGGGETGGGETGGGETGGGTTTEPGTGTGEGEGPTPVV